MLQLREPAPQGYSSSGALLMPRARHEYTGRVDRRPTALIADDDLGFVWWLGQVLAEVGIRGVPALTYRQGLARIKMLKGHIDLVIANPDLPGSSKLIEAVDAKLIILQDI